MIIAERRDAWSSIKCRSNGWHLSVWGVTSRRLRRGFVKPYLWPIAWSTRGSIWWAKLSGPEHGWSKYGKVSCPGAQARSTTQLDLNTKPSQSHPNHLFGKSALTNYTHVFNVSIVFRITGNVAADRLHSHITMCDCQSQVKCIQFLSVCPQSSFIYIVHRSSEDY